MEGMEDGVGGGYLFTVFVSRACFKKIRYRLWDEWKEGRKVLEVATSSLFSSPELASERFSADSGTNGRQEGVAGGYIFNGRVYGASWNNLLVTATGNSLLRRVLSDR